MRVHAAAGCGFGGLGIRQGLRLSKAAVVLVCDGARLRYIPKPLRVASLLNPCATLTQPWNPSLDPSPYPLVPHTPTQHPTPLHAARWRPTLRRRGRAWWSLSNASQTGKITVGLN